MGQIRECTVCARRMYSLARTTWDCSVDGCSGAMVLISIKDRPATKFKLDGSKLGEFW